MRYCIRNTLQNFTVGKNHNQWLPDYEYKAWYKADPSARLRKRTELHIGHEVTPKTNPGDYIIQSTGDIRVRAGKSISLKPGFHAQAGSDFHAEIWSTSCDCPREEDKSFTTNNEENNQGGDFERSLSSYSDMVANDKQFMQLIPNPNEGNFQLKLNYDNPEGVVYVYSITGSLMHTQKVLFKENTLNPIAIGLNLENGVYVVRWSNGMLTESKKMIIR